MLLPQDRPVRRAELRYEVDGRFLESRRYRGAECARMKPDAEQKKQESIAMRWTVEEQR